MDEQPAGSGSDPAGCFRNRGQAPLWNHLENETKIAEGSPKISANIKKLIVK
jgi:hypothetical protein